ncbi:MAG: signal peptide peptidase SppA [Thermoanaerobaculia bacterium]
MKTLRWIILVLFLIFLAFGLILFFAFKEEGLKKNTILKVTLSGEIMEYVPKSSFPLPFGRKVISLYDYVQIIRDAAKNPKIVGLYIRLKPFSMGAGKIEELMDAIEEFNKSGKPSFVYTETFGEFGPATGSVWLASSAKKIYIHPDGYVNLIGIYSETPFLRGTLDKLHIYPDFDHIAEYKTAMNLFTEKKFTDAHREMMDSLTSSIFENMVISISKNRNIKKEEIISAIEKGPLSAKEALKLKLIDGLLYEDELEEKLKEIGGKDYNLISESKYKIEPKIGEKIAIIFGMGGIYVGRSEGSPFGGSEGMGSETVAKYFRDARKDKDIKAVIFRVDSPGGSAIASEIIRRELLLTKKEKPVVVSMSDVAGSGGYWVSMSASSIISRPSTLTGSIGVVVGKFNTKGFWEDLLGITFETLKKGENADFYSSLQNFTPQQREVLKKMMTEIYDQFVQNVSKDRGIPEERVREIAKGRVWTGAQALELKLVDKIGGFKEAVEEAKKLAKIPEKEEVQIVIYPKPKNFLEILMQQERDSEIKAMLKSYLIRNLPLGPLWCPYKIVLN